MQVLPLVIIIIIINSVITVYSQKLSLFLQLFFEIRENKIREIISFQLYNIKVVCVCVCVWL